MKETLSLHEKVSIMSSGAGGAGGTDDAGLTDKKLIPITHLPVCQKNPLQPIENTGTMELPVQAGGGVGGLVPPPAAGGNVEGYWSNPVLGRTEASLLLFEVQKLIEA
uniref:Uncharacterized protein n=1 Tax=Anopheles culicifacies TaxID=139723 RepID=A0A182LYI3_9DIPT